MKFRSKIHPYVWITYGLLLAAHTFVILTEEANPFIYAISPFALFLPLLYRIKAKYYLQDDHLIIKHQFDKIPIPYNKIRSIENRSNPVWKGWILGIPGKTIWLKYNTYDEIELYVAHRKTFMEELKKVHQQQGIAEF